MIKLISYILIFLIAIALGLALNLDAGYLAISYNHYTVGMPLWFAIIGVFATFFILYFVLRSINIVSNIPKRIKLFIKQIKSKKANLYLEKALIKLIEGHFRKAEKILAKSAEDSNIKMTYYLLAALCAHKQNNYSKQDEYLYKAYLANPKEEFVISLIQAKMLFEQEQFESALTTLMRFKSIHKKHPNLLVLLKDIYIKLNDWNNLIKILPKLNKIIDERTLNNLEILAYKNLLSKDDIDFKTLKKTWKKTPKKLRQNAQILFVYCKQLLRFKKQKETISLISKYLHKKWDEKLVELFGLIKTPNPEIQLKTAENWLKKHKKDAMLFLTLGRLASQFKHWAKAEEYLITSLNLRKIEEAYYELGFLYEKIGKTEKALAIYRKRITPNSNSLVEK